MSLLTLELFVHEWFLDGAGSKLNQTLLLFRYLAFVVDQGNHVFVWIGSRASENEKKNSLQMAHVSLKW